MLHIIGDIIQSIGVILAAITIYFFPSFQFIDPLATMLFCVIVVVTTVPIIREVVGIIMESAPMHIDSEIVKEELSKVNKYF